MEQAKIEEVVIKTGKVEGTLATPLVAPNDAPTQLVFILHGLGGHRDYCYQEMLGRALPERLGITTFRFDFRSCGNSDPVPDPTLGRSVGGTDFEDITEVYDYFCRARNFELLAFVGHSRGCSDMFHWSLKNQKTVKIPMLINCSGRYRAYQYLERAIREDPNMLARDGYFLTAKRYGKYEKQWIAREEVIEFGLWTGNLFTPIDHETQILTIFGSKDQHVPLTDAAFWANQFGDRHELQIIKDADHNFYSRDKDGKKVNHNPEVVELICKYMTPQAESARFYKAHQVASVVPRWPQVDGVLNFRDFGYGNVKRGILFRSAALEAISSGGIEKLHSLGIKWVFDLRSDPEAARNPTPPLPGIKVIRNPVSKDSDMSPAALAEIAVLMADENGGFTRNYMGILQAGKHAFANVLRTLRDYPGEGILIHCAAGKDRTGVLCALILLLLGVDSYTVARDYELTSVGWGSQMAPLADVIREKLATWNVSNEHILALLSSTYPVMKAFIAALNSEYKDAFHYFLHTGLTTADLEAIRTNLLSPAPVPSSRL